MFNRLLITCFLFLIPFSSTVSAAEKNRIEPEMRKIVATFPYEGDKKGDFKYERVVVLDDGSWWKIHGTKEQKLLNWNSDDEIYVGLRHKSYWFKQEHKFQLVNPAKDERIKVMLVNYPEQPLQIISTESYLIGTELRSMTTYVQGKSHVSYYYVNRYGKRLFLSDNSIWKIEDENKKDKFSVGKNVYIGTDIKGKKGAYFFIGGIESKAFFVTAYKTK